MSHLRDRSPTPPRPEPRYPRATMTPFSAPAKPAAKMVGRTEVSLNWTLVGARDGYLVEGSTNGTIFRAE